MHAGIAEVRAARRIRRDVGADAFELSAANVFQFWRSGVLAAASYR